jgi:hypothetical protein
MTKARELAKLGEVMTNSQIGGRRNLIINGAMQVAQRGTSIAVSSTLVYTLDRFACENDTTTMTATQASDAPTDFEYSLKLTNGTGATPTGSHINRIRYALEGYDTNHLEIGTANAKKVTLSFHVKSSITGTYVVGFLDSGNDNGYIADYTINSANTWEKKTITLTMSDYGSWVGSSTNSINLILHWDLGSGPDRDVSTLNVWNDGASNDFSHSSQVDWVGTTGSTFYLTGVQLEVGSQATPFEHRSFGEELALCSRYYFQKIKGNDEPVGVCVYKNSTQLRVNIEFPTEMRSDPTVTTTNSTDHFQAEGTATDNFDGNWTVVQTSTTSGMVYSNTNVSSTQGEAGAVRSNSADARLAFSSEL